MPRQDSNRTHRAKQRALTTRAGRAAKRYQPPFDPSRLERELQGVRRATR